MTVSQGDLSRSEWTTVVCRCGTLFAAAVWRRIDVEADASRHELALTRGALDGTCPGCGAAASGRPTWLALWPSKRVATLMIDEGRRGAIVDELIAHLQRIGADPKQALPWLLQPAFVFVTPPAASAPVADGVHLASSEPGTRGNVPVSDGAWTAALGTPKPTTGHPSAPLGPLPDPATLFSAPFTPRAATAAVASPATGVAQARTTVREPGVPLVRVDPKSLEAGIPMLIGPDAAPMPGGTSVARDLGASVAGMTVDGGLVRVAASIDDAVLEQWESATIHVRPIHLREFGYPLVGVRLVAKHFGQQGCIDAVVDPGHPTAAEVFRALAERFAVELRCAGSHRTITRMVVADGLEPNAALCIESARGVLARGENPPEEFVRARAALERQGVAERLKVPSEAITAGAYPHIVGGAEATRALLHLDRVSQKESLARLLEVDGLPMGEYDAIRRRVLEGSVAHGLCVPRRFWRRLIATGLARDLTDYARQLAENRAAHVGEEGDLEPADAVAAWQDIVALCRRKDLPIPTQVREALQLPDAPPPGPASRGPAAASGEILGDELLGDLLVADDAFQDGLLEDGLLEDGLLGDGLLGDEVLGDEVLGDEVLGDEVLGDEVLGDEVLGDEVLGDEVLGDERSGHTRARQELRDPAQRLRVATDILQGHAHGNFELVLAALDSFDTDELLAIMPDLSDLGPRAVPGLIAKLRSERREVRQAAVILLGMSMEPSVLDPLADHLVREPSAVWVDVGRAMGGFGSSAIRALCQILRRESGSPREALAIDRVSRALAEIALSDAEPRGGGASAAGASGSAAIEALAAADDPRVSTAARRALASLREVKASGAQIRGEIPLAEETEVRGFARRAYEAIMVPELEAEAEA